MCKFSVMSFFEFQEEFNMQITEDDKVLIVFDSNGCKNCSLDQKNIKAKFIHKLKVKLPISSNAH